MLGAMYATTETFKQLSTFGAVAELNEAVRQHKYANDLTTTDESVLNVIARHACKFVGVCFIRKSAIAEQVGKSRRTVVRVCNKLAELGIIAQQPLQRKNGDRMQTANAIVVQPADYADIETMHEITNVTPMTAQETNNLKQKLNNKNTKETKTDSESTTQEKPVVKEEQTNNAEVVQPKQPQDPKKALAKSLPKGFYELMSPFAETAEQLYAYMGCLFKAKASVSDDILLEDHLEDYAVAFLNVMRKTHRGQVKNLMGYMYSTFRSASLEIARHNSWEFLHDFYSAD